MPKCKRRPFHLPPRPPALGELELDPEDYEALGPSQVNYEQPLDPHVRRDFFAQQTFRVTGGQSTPRNEDPVKRRTRRKGYRKELHVREKTREYEREYGQRPDVKVKKSERYDNWAKSEKAKALIAARARKYRAKLKKLGKKVVRKKPYKRKSRAKLSRP